MFVCFLPEPQRSRCNDQSAGRAGWDQDYFGRTFSWITCNFNKKKRVIIWTLKGYIFKFRPFSNGKFGWMLNIILSSSYLSVAQHHGKSPGERRKTGRPGGKVRTSGKPVQGLLQDCEYETELSTLGQSSLSRQIWLHSRVSTFNPQARKQNSCCEVMWCHHLVLVDTPLYAFLLFLQLPSCLQRLNQWTQGLLRKWEGFISRRGWGWHRSVTSADCGYLRGGLKKQWGCSGVEVIFVLFLSFTSVNICAVFEHQLKTFDIVYWWCLLKQLKIT